MATVLNPYLEVAAPASQATLVGFSTGKNTITLHASTASGDLCLIFCDANAPTSISGWTSAFAGSMRYFKKIVTGGDLSTPITIQDSGGPQVSGVSVSLRDCSIATQKAAATDAPAATITLSGFTRNAGHKGLVAAGWSLNSGLTPGGSWSASSNSPTGDVGHIFKASALTDNSYTSGSSVTFGTGAVDDEVGAVMLELT